MLCMDFWRVLLLQGSLWGVKDRVQSGRLANGWTVESLDKRCRMRYSSEPSDTKFLAERVDTSKSMHRDSRKSRHERCIVRVRRYKLSRDSTVALTAQKLVAREVDAEATED